MSTWKGKSRGTLLGFKVYVKIIRTLGLFPAYAILYGVAAYFMLFSYTSTRSTFYLFRKRLGKSFLASLIHVYRSYINFGKVQLDRIAITNGLKHKFTFEFDGVTHINDLLKKKQGGILLTAHIGNFNLAKHFFEQQHTDAVVNLVVTDFENEQIKQFMHTVTGTSEVNIIVMRDDLSHIFAMKKALEQNELLIFAADRFTQKAGTMTAGFLGKTTRFPEGPFKLAARNKIPVLFVHLMKEKGLHYHFYARPFKAPVYTSKEILKSYLDDLERMVKKYPHQWYNYYDYWNDFS